MLKVKEIMTPGVETIISNLSVKDAAMKMQELNVGILPVVENDHVTGMLTDRDIMLRVVAEDIDPMSTSVGEIMTREIISCQEDSSVEEAARIMEDHKVRRLLIKDSSGMMTGIVSLGDIATHVGGNLAGEVLEEVAHPSQPRR